VNLSQNPGRILAAGSLQ